MHCSAWDCTYIGSWLPGSSARCKMFLACSLSLSLQCSPHIIPARWPFKALCFQNVHSRSPSRPPSQRHSHVDMPMLAAPGCAKSFHLLCTWLTCVTLCASDGQQYRTVVGPACFSFLNWRSEYLLQRQCVALEHKERTAPALPSDLKCVVVGVCFLEGCVLGGRGGEHPFGLPSVWKATAST